MHRLQLGTTGRSDGVNNINGGEMSSWPSPQIRELNSPNSATYPQQATHYELAESSMHDAALD